MRWFGLACISMALLLCSGCALTNKPKQTAPPSHESQEKEHTYLTALPDPPMQEEVDDRIDDKHPAFDENRIDSRLLEGWEVNQSAAVIKLDCPKLGDSADIKYATLYPSYARLLKSKKPLFPSANVINGASKQIDDGLYAALDLAWFRGSLSDAIPGAVDFIAAVFDQLRQISFARPYLAAALHYAGRVLSLNKKEARIQKRIIADFEASPMLSKPIGFYTWSPELEQVWKFFRMLQQEYTAKKDLSWIRDIAEVLAKDQKLNETYSKLRAFHGSLTNPGKCLPVTALNDETEDLSVIAKKYGVRHACVAVFPSSNSKEDQLIEQITSMGISPQLNLMDEVIKSIRSGRITFTPQPEDGWYQYQLHALECLLLTDKNPESERLLLTAEYKKRLVKAFKVMFTKTRETHAEIYSACAPACAAEPCEPIKRPRYVYPRLRIEPCPEVYLRTARAYAFLENFLKATLSSEPLNTIHGLREKGERSLTLGQELESIRLRYYGFYLIACEDIGMAPKFMGDEPVDQKTALDTAQTWLDHLGEDPDLACDTRVAIPICYDPDSNTARLWVTVGIGLSSFEASYARPPMIRPHADGGPWQEVSENELRSTNRDLPTDEFLEVEINADKIPNREELRALCDRCTTKEEIQQALEALK